MITYSRSNYRASCRRGNSRCNHPPSYFLSSYQQEMQIEAADWWSLSHQHTGRSSPIYSLGIPLPLVTQGQIVGQTDSLLCLQRRLEVQDFRDKGANVIPLNSSKAPNEARARGRK
ncbi:hypothetical protein P691DRAFT_322431 [Macrolepiota fuliginosa MF-IS2]|uniref:Uncharacterized protein n=1 Tax=Macrolepiota fuliginosa MF-IS2 TaxID=1400762 RepID=A0A9P6C4H5_9AGAR|nr:hypothetical protein P691DRAFT_322431 [Macrolepiota fuliginosa MF-IS2]